MSNEQRLRTVLGSHLKMIEDVATIKAELAELRSGKHDCHKSDAIKANRAGLVSLKVKVAGIAASITVLVAVAYLFLRPVLERGLDHMAVEADTEDADSWAGSWNGDG